MSLHNSKTKQCNHPFDLDFDLLLKLKFEFPENQPSSRMLNRISAIKGIKLKVILLIPK